VAIVSPTTMALPGVRAELRRVPFDLGARARLRGGRLGITGDAGAVIAVLLTRGLDSPVGMQSTRVELGLRAAVAVELDTSRVAPFLALQAELIPRAYDLVLPGTGTVGTTPQMWLGAILGLSIKLR
jgi:hypothetical protein